MVDNRRSAAIRNSLPGIGLALGAGIGMTVGIAFAGGPGLTPGTIVGAAVGLIAGAVIRAFGSMRKYRQTTSDR